jgi:4-aminobutyrate aminotransferase-like enzyme
MKAIDTEKIINEYIERDERCFKVSHRGFPGFVVLEGRGTVIKDARGKQFLDFSTPSAIVGHNHPKIVEAIKIQTEKLTHFNHGIVYAHVKLAETLKEIAPYSLKDAKVVFGCSGTDIIEAALKLAKYFTKKSVVISHVGGHHGRLPGVLSFTSDYSKSKIRHSPYILDSLYIPFPYCYRCLLGQVFPDCSLACLDYVAHLLDQVVPPEGVAAILAEPLLSWSGFIKPPPHYFSKLQRLCNENGILLVDDEVFTGFGRTGKMFAMEHFEVEPSVMCLGKPMGGGMPVSALLAHRQMIDQWETGSMCTSSSAGNLCACISSLTAIEIIKEEKLAQKAQKLGEYLMAGLKDQVGENRSCGNISGMGLLVGIELVKNKNTKEPDPRKAEEVFTKAFQKGILLNQITGAYHHVVRIVPPLTVTIEQIDRLIEVLYEVFQKM